MIVFNREPVQSSFEGLPLRAPVTRSLGGFRLKSLEGVVYSGAPVVP